ncbi:hypothetical protein B0H63DRAFT_531093 [Podospora didyma]|uniref:Uncharacterized protein n=1 Tax=Podospora didyma TaxID=330526 RepID=A0AAE0P4Y7_9PEZI|nr:hypothetical protein B0H63DRAFT_531093 [Podospora didyma]
MAFPYGRLTTPGPQISDEIADQKFRVIFDRRRNPFQGLVDLPIAGDPLLAAVNSTAFRERALLDGGLLGGFGGNNGSTVTVGIIADRRGFTWETPEGPQSANYD